MTRASLAWGLALLAICGLIPLHSPQAAHADVPDHLQTCRQLAGFASRAGGVADEAIDLDLAERSCSAASEANPLDFESIAYRARIHWVRSKIEDDQAERDKARALAEQAALQWQPDAMLMLGLLADSDGEHAKAMDWHLRAAERGNPTACVRVAIGYGAGLGIDEDLVESGRWLARCRVEATVDQRGPIDAYAGEAIQKLLKDNAEKIEDPSYVGTPANARGLLHIVDFNEAYFGPGHDYSTNARGALDGVLDLMNPQDRTIALVGEVTDSLAAAAALSDRGAFFAATDKANRALKLAERITEANWAGDFTPVETARTSLGGIWLAAMPDISMELSEADFFDGIFPLQRLRDAQALTELLAPYAGELVEMEQIPVRLQKAEARWIALWGDVDRAAGLYEDAYRREASLAGDGDAPSAEAVPAEATAAGTASAERERKEWFRARLLEAASVVVDESKTPQERLLAIRAPFLEQDPDALLALYDESFTALNTGEALAALLAPSFEEGFLFEPDMQGAEAIFDDIAAKQFSRADDWVRDSFPLFSDATIPQEERLAKVVAIIDAEGGSPFSIDENIRRLLDLHRSGSAADAAQVAEIAVELQNTTRLMASSLWSARLGETILALHPELGSLETFRQAIGAAKYSAALDGTTLLFGQYNEADGDTALLAAVAGRATALNAYAASEPPAWSASDADATRVADSIIELAKQTAGTNPSMAVSMLVNLYSLGAVSVEELPALLALRDFAATHFEHDNDLFVHQALDRVRTRAKLGLEIAMLSAMRSFTNGELEAAAGFSAEARTLASVAFEASDTATASVGRWQASMPGVAVAEQALDPAVRRAYETVRDIHAEVQVKLDTTPPPGFDMLEGAEDPGQAARPLDLLALDALARIEAIRRVGGERLPARLLSSITMTIDEFRLGAYPGVARDLAEAIADHYRMRPDAATDTALMERYAAQAAVLAGDFDGAFVAYERAVGSLTAAKQTAQPLFRALLIDMAGLYARTGRADVAESVFRSYPDVLPIVSRAGMAFPTTALDTAIDGLHATADQFPLTVWASSLGPTANTIAALSLSDGNLPVASAWVSALNVAEATDEINGWDVDAASLRAQILIAQGRSSEAVAVLQPLVRDIAEGEDAAPLATAAARLALARAQAKAGDTAGASQSVQRALEEVRGMDRNDNPVLAAFHWEAGNIAAADGRLPDAVASYREAVRRVRDPATGFLRSAVWDPGWADRFTAQRTLDDLLDALWAMGGANGDAALAEQAFEASQLSALAAAASAISEATIRNAATDPKLRRLLRERQDALRRLKSIHDTLADDITAASEVVGTRSPERLRGEIAELDAQLATLSPDLAAALKPRSTGIAELRRSLEPGEAALKVKSGETVTHVFLVDRERIVWQRAEVPLETLQDQVTVLRKALDPATMSLRSARPIGQASEDEFPFEASLALYDLVFKQALEADGRTPQRVFYDAGGPLETLPLQVLLRRPVAGGSLDERLRQADWLARHVAVTVVPSIASISMPPAEASSGERLAFFGIGAPDFAGASVDQPPPVQVADASGPGSFGELFRGGAANLDAIAELAPLPEARDELLAISRSLGGDPDSVVTGAGATQKALFALPLRSYRVMAFATHGLVAGEISQLAEPALALTPVADEAGDDGLLTMSEVAQLDLDAEWVILSACNTASSDGRAGSGALSGLAQAFFYAGAQRLLVSNWPVISQAAVKVTTRTMASYTDASGKPAADALQAAIVSILDDPASTTLERHPAYWGPFSLVSRMR